MLYGYIRVSTIEQDTARQRADILEAANTAGLQVCRLEEGSKRRSRALPKTGPSTRSSTNWKTATLSQ